MKAVNIHEAKTKLSALIAEVEATGAGILICRNGTPVAELSLHTKRDRVTPDPLLGRITIDYDPTEPLGDDEWPEEGHAP